MISKLIRDVKPETVVLELCEDRYEDWFYDISSHPNYDKTMTELHKLLEKEDMEKVLDYK